MDFPLHYFEGNLMFTPDRKCWAFYELPGFQIDFKSLEMRKRLFSKMLGFFWSIDKSAKLLFLPENHTFAEHYEKNVIPDISGPFQETGIHFAELSTDWLENAFQKSGSFKYRFFVSLKISEELKFWDSIKNIKDFVVKLAKEPFYKTDRFFGLLGNEIPSEDIRLLREMEDRVYKRIAKYTPTLRAEEQLIEWAVRRNFWKGIATPPQRFLWSEKGKAPKKGKGLKIPTLRRAADTITVGEKQYIRPRAAEFLPMTEGYVDTKRNPRMVAITQRVGTEEITVYSAYLTLTDKPDELSAPGSEYIYMLHDFDFPVAASMHLEPLAYSEAKSKLNNSKKDIEDQTDHTASSFEDLPINLQEARRDAIFLEKDMDDNKFPLFDWSMVFEVTAHDEKTLWERVDVLIDTYKSYQFELVNPAGEQWQLLNEFMPIGERLCSKDYVHRVSPHVLAASMFGATKRLGDDVGPFIGTTGAMNIPVYFSLPRAPKLNRSGSGAILGSLGGGKSFTGNLLAHIATRNGGKSLFFDPKGDRSDWKDYIHEFGDELEIVRLSSHEKDHGKLDPWGIFDDPEEAASVAINIITFLGNVRIEDQEFVHLTEAVDKVKLLSQKNRSMYAILKQLDESDEEEGKKLARKIRSFSRLPLAKLLIHDGPLNTIRTDRRMTVLQVDQLNLPEADTPKEDYDIIQMLSVAFMMAISAFAIRFSEENPEEFTTVVLDEFWALSGTKEGKRLATRLIRAGRSFFASIIIITQNANDLLDERIKNNLGFKFVFRSGDNTEVKNILKFLDLEETDENIETIKSLENGKPLFQDLDGRCGIVDIEPIFQHLYDAFDTTPGKKKKVS